MCLVLGLHVVCVHPEHEQQVCEMRERVTRVEAELQQTREAAKVHAAAEEATRSHQHHLMSKVLACCS